MKFFVWKFTNFQKIQNPPGPFLPLFSDFLSFASSSSIPTPAPFSSSIPTPALFSSSNTTFALFSLLQLYLRPLLLFQPNPLHLFHSFLPFLFHPWWITLGPNRSLPLSWFWADGGKPSICSSWNRSKASQDCKICQKHRQSSKRNGKNRSPGINLNSILNFKQKIQIQFFFKTKSKFFRKKKWIKKWTNF